MSDLYDAFGNVIYASWFQRTPRYTPDPLFDFINCKKIDDSTLRFSKINEEKID